jgi:glycosyltransferase involved in cell wall biosynthesis
MAAGVPVLANRIPAHEALLGRDLSDRLVTFGAADAAAVALDDVLSLGPDAVERLAALERARAERFGIRRLGDDIEAIYAEIGLA